MTSQPTLAETIATIIRDARDFDEADASIEKLTKIAKTDAEKCAIEDMGTVGLLVRFGRSV